MFCEVCVYEAKIEKQDEIEQLMREVAEFYRAFPGVTDVRYVKRTHRQESFQAVKAGEPPVRLTRYVGKVTYMLFLTLEDAETHGRLAVPAMEQFYKRWNRCLLAMPKIYLGETIA